MTEMNRPDVKRDQNDDTEGWRNPRLSPDIEPADDDAAVSGHKFYSDRDVKRDVEPVDGEQADDAAAVRGHRFYSDREVKRDVEPVRSAGPEDVKSS